MQLLHSMQHFVANEGKAKDKGRVLMKEGTPFWGTQQRPSVGIFQPEDVEHGICEKRASSGNKDASATERFTEKEDYWKMGTWLNDPLAINGSNGEWLSGVMQPLSRASNWRGRGTRALAPRQFARC